MQTFASALIDRLGGTTEVATLTDAAVSTVHNMRRKITPARLNHLRRVAHMEKPSIDVAELARQHGVELLPLGRDGSCEPCTADEQVPA